MTWHQPGVVPRHLAVVEDEIVVAGPPDRHLTTIGLGLSLGAIAPDDPEPGGRRVRAGDGEHRGVGPAAVLVRVFRRLAELRRFVGVACRRLGRPVGEARIDADLCPVEMAVRDQLDARSIDQRVVVGASEAECAIRKLGGQSRRQIPEGGQVVRVEIHPEPIRDEGSPGA